MKAILGILFLCMSLTPVMANPGTGTAQQRIQVSQILPVFTQLQVSGNIKVYLHSGNTTQVEAEIPEHLREFFEMEVNEGVLFLTLNKSVNRFDMPIVNLTLSELNSITADGNYFIRCEEKLKTNRMNIHLKGEGLLNLWLETQDLKVELNQFAVAAIKGQSHEAVIYGSQSAQWRGQGLSAEKLFASVSDNGQAIVNASREGILLAENSGKIEYCGAGLFKSFTWGNGSVVQIPTIQ